MDYALASFSSLQLLFGVLAVLLLNLLRILQLLELSSGRIIAKPRVASPRQLLAHRHAQQDQANTHRLLSSFFLCIWYSLISSSLDWAASSATCLFTDFDERIDPVREAGVGRGVDRALGAPSFFKVSLGHAQSSHQVKMVPARTHRPIRT